MNWEDAYLLSQQEKKNNSEGEEETRYALYTGDKHSNSGELTFLVRICGKKTAYGRKMSLIEPVMAEVGVHVNVQDNQKWVENKKLIML